MGTTPDRLPPGPLTYEDYVELPDDGRIYEILDGELFVTPAPVPRHPRVSANLQWLLTGHVRKHQLGEILNAPIDLILSQTTIARPDLVFIRTGHESIVTERAIERVPTSSSRFSLRRPSGRTGRRRPDSTRALAFRITGSSIPRSAPSRRSSSGAVRTGSFRKRGGTRSCDRQSFPVSSSRSGRSGRRATILPCSPRSRYLASGPELDVMKNGSEEETASDLWYFGYGSNMSRAIFHGRRRMRPREERWGWLHGFELHFNLPIGPGERGVANVEPSKTGRVCGVLYRLTPDAFDFLDRTEGVHRGFYRRIAVEVLAEGRERVAAWTYQSGFGTSGRKPSARYIGLMLDGAREFRLPADWITHLESFDLAVDERHEDPRQGKLGL